MRDVKVAAASLGSVTRVLLVFKRASLSAAHSELQSKATLGNAIHQAGLVVNSSLFALLPIIAAPEGSSELDT